MTEEQFREGYHGAPYSLYEFAEMASEITDNGNLASAAQKFVEASLEFEEQLDAICFEVG